MRTPNNERLSADIAGTPRAAAAAPERRCVLSGASGPRDALVRLALGPDGQVLPDVLERAPGRGAWIGADRATLETAIGNGKLRAALQRAFRTNAVDVPPDLADRIAAALRRLLTDRLGLELRCGFITLGAQRIEKTARDGKVELLLHAGDARPDGAAKLDQAWRVGSEAEGSGQAGERLPLDRAALSVAMGRDNVVHLAITDMRAAQRVAAVLARLRHYEGTGVAGDGNCTAPLRGEPQAAPAAAVTMDQEDC